METPVLSLYLLLYLACTWPGQPSQGGSMDHRSQSSAGRVRRDSANWSFTLQECGNFPCFAMTEDIAECEHAVGIPRNLVATPGAEGACGDLETVIVSWTSSWFGISFLRGFQVRVRAIDSWNNYYQCRQLAVKPGVVLSAQQVIETIFCLPPDSQYSISVNVYPIPAGRNREAGSIQYTAQRAPDNETADCGGLSGRRRTECLTYWLPETISFQQEGTSVTVSFSPAPESYGFNTYHIYYGQVPRGSSRPADWQKISVPHKGERAVSALLGDLQPGYNYSVIIFSDFEYARRRLVTHYVSTDDVDAFPVKWIIISLAILVAVIAACIFIARRIGKNRARTQDAKSWIEDGNKREQCVVPEILRARPRVLLCYCDWGGKKLVRLVLLFAAYLQEHCGCRVALDLWDQRSVACEGPMVWLSRRIEESDYVIVLCSRGLKAWVETRPGDPRPTSPGAEALWEGTMTIAAVSMIAERLRQAFTRSRDVSKFIAASFCCSGHDDVPGVLDLASKYCLMEQFPLLFAQLHSTELCGPGYTRYVDNISQDTYWRTPAGLALYNAISDLYGEQAHITET